MGHSQDTVPPVAQPTPALTPSQSLPGETSTASSSVTHSVPIEASVPPSRSAAVQHAASPSTSSAGTPRKSPTRPPLIPDMYVDTLVAFAPEKEGWTKRQNTKDKYIGVGSAYLVGRVCRIVKGAMFQAQWLDSQYQNKDEHLDLSMIQRGNANYRFLHGGSTRVGWSHLCAVDEGENIQVNGDIDEMEECMEVFDPPMDFPATLAEVEAIMNMRLEPGAQSEEPPDLFRHSDSTTTTRLLPQFKHIFEHSASAGAIFLGANSVKVKLGQLFKTLKCGHIY
ncbi:hypothetical protein PC128_g18047 [Phytophthora cactorum]|nr:hypothetical protein PC120_g19716 [Phytophthora cactorum]KAG3174464.1 hypothetical protein PC128_g18047 [Phytophthora cactorum]